MRAYVTITVQATDGSGVSSTCEVFVSANTPVKSITVSPETLNLMLATANNSMPSSLRRTLTLRNYAGSQTILKLLPLITMAW